MRIVQLANLTSRLAALPPIWHVLWVGLACLSLALIVLSRTRWGQSKPMHKCAVLSLVAHVLLACLATTVKIVTTVSHPSDRPEVRVALVSGEEGAPTKIDLPRKAQPWEALMPGPVSRPVLPALQRPPVDVELPQIAVPEFLEGHQGDAEEPFALPASDALASLASKLPVMPVVTQQKDSPVAPESMQMPPREAPQVEVVEPKLIGTDDLQERRGNEGLMEPATLENLEHNWLAGEQGDADVLLEQPETILPAIDQPLTVHSSLLHREATNPSNTVQTPSDALPVVVRSSTTDEDGSDSGQPPHNIRSDSISNLQPPVLGSGPTETTADHPSVYRHRQPNQRVLLVEKHGGSEETEAAVQQALAWLARAQSDDGRWDVVRHGGGREFRVYGHDRQGAGMNADTGISGLALLAFLGAGHTHEGGSHQDTVRRGLDFLIRGQHLEGDLAGEATLYARMYCHAMATFALSEAYAMTGDRRLRQPLQNAIAYTVASQHAGGGWRYRPGDPGDTSQLGWQLMALRSAELAGIVIPETTWQGAEKFLQSVARGRAGGLAAYQPGTGVSRPMSAEASYCHLLMADRKNRLRDAGPACDETAEYLHGELPGTSRANYYYWYYGTLLLHLRQQSGPNAHQDWQLWNEALKKTLLASQHTTGPLAGAWANDTLWGGYGGRVFTTALATLCLETYYRYLPLLEGPEQRTAHRPGLLHQPAFDTPPRPDRID